jgi:hypothetical protein
VPCEFAQPGPVFPYHACHFFASTEKVATLTQAWPGSVFYDLPVNSQERFPESNGQAQDWPLCL